jgi:hypothetical protein
LRCRLTLHAYKARSGAAPQRHRAPADADVLQCCNWVWAA